ncbi:MAG: amidohydrolase family protein [Planctomycetota bacterium]
MRLPVIAPLFCLLATLAGSLAADPVTTPPAEGLRGQTPGWYALVGVRLVLPGGGVQQDATIVIRGGRFVAAGVGVDAPAGAKRIELDGRMVYPGFIDAYSELAVKASPRQPGYWTDTIRPQQSVAPAYKPDAAVAKSLRSQGVAARLVAPKSGIIKGTSVVALTCDAPASEALIAKDVATHIALTVPFGSRGGEGPDSPMGAVAAARQAMIDAAWRRDAAAAFAARPASPRPEANLALEALAENLDGGRLMIADAANELYALRADRFAREFGLRIALRGSGNEYRRLAEIAATGRAVIVPVNFPKPPEVDSPEAAADIRLEELMHWRLAPENAGRLAAAGVPIALTSHGLKDRGAFLGHCRKAVKRGLSPAAALAALTTTPAELLGVDHLVGGVAPGKIANLVVADGDLFAGDARVLSTWVAGQEYVVQRDAAPRLDGDWLLEVAGADAKAEGVVLSITATGGKKKAVLKPEHEEADHDEADHGAAEQDGEQDDKPTGDGPANAETPDAHTPDPETPDTRTTDAEQDAEQTDETGAAKPATIKELTLNHSRITGRVDGKLLGVDGTLLLAANAVESGGSAQLTGTLQSLDGAVLRFTGTRVERADGDQDHSSDDSAGGDDKGDDDTGADANSKEGGADEPGAVESDAVESDADEPDADWSPAVNYPLGAYGRSTPPEQPDAVLFRGATVWTCDTAGTLEEADVLVSAGVIVQVAEEIAAPAGAVVIDAAGKHLTPGLIDCHSHMATDGGVNEASQAITAEVRIGDFVNPDDITIYRQLAGGLTTANVLHGSANPIGGQNQVIKLRWGAGMDAMRFAEAPPGIKFALGENVKQSNWGEEYTTRYPQTRMGVDEIMIDAFNAARVYAARQRAWRQDPVGPAPRRDLELEAIAQILAGERWVHCHSYKQSEILTLLRTLESFGVTIGTLQHILEGYKVAPEMAAHGAGGSSFADWWAYKFEVYDAIPYNGALMHRAGVCVSFNSDDDELGRHMNHEAAKAVKYGGVSPDEALKFVTLNPAIQLRIDQHVGSIKAGKHADLALWSGPPLAITSVCEQTWIDGRRYFDIEEDRRVREQQRELRWRLIKAVIDSGEPAAKPGENPVDPSSLWPRHDDYCHHYDGEGHGHGGHGHDHHGHGHE